MISKIYKNRIIGLAPNKKLICQTEKFFIFSIAHTLYQLAAQRYQKTIVNVFISITTDHIKRAGQLMTLQHGANDQTFAFSGKFLSGHQLLYCFRKIFVLISCIVLQRLRPGHQTTLIHKPVVLCNTKERPYRTFADLHCFQHRDKRMYQQAKGSGMHGLTAVHIFFHGHKWCDTMLHRHRKPMLHTVLKQNLLIPGIHLNICRLILDRITFLFGQAGIYHDHLTNGSVLYRHLTGKHDFRQKLCHVAILCLLDKMLIQYGIPFTDQPPFKGTNRKLGHSRLIFFIGCRILLPILHDIGI